MATSNRGFSFPTKSGSPHFAEIYLADWEPGDALIVENACVHQHFSQEEDDECITLVMKAKPLFLFMHLLFQKIAEYPPKDGTPKQLAYKPPAEL